LACSGNFPHHANTTTGTIVPIILQIIREKSLEINEKITKLVLQLVESIRFNPKKAAYWKRFSYDNKCEAGGYPERYPTEKK
jgi:hypothetical protein